jgi:hypothetical protein
MAGSGIPAGLAVPRYGTLGVGCRGGRCMWAGFGAGSVASSEW